MEKNPGKNLWERFEVPAFIQLLTKLDDELMKYIQDDPSGVLLRAFCYFDSDPKNPLTPREFFQYWKSLTVMERLNHVFFFSFFFS